MVPYTRETHGHVVDTLARVMGSEEPHAIATVEGVNGLVIDCVSTPENTFFVDLNDALAAAYPGFAYTAVPASPILLTEIPSGLVVVLLPHEAAAQLDRTKLLNQPRDDFYRVFVLQMFSPSFLVDHVAGLVTAAEAAESANNLAKLRAEQEKLASAVGVIRRQLATTADDLERYVQHGRCGDKTGDAEKLLAEARMYLGQSAPPEDETNLTWHLLNDDQKTGIAAFRLWQVALLVGAAFEEFLAAATRKLPARV